MEFVEICVIIIGLLMLLHILSGGRKAGFWSDRRSSDSVLESYANKSDGMHSNVRKMSFLPANKIILKGHSSEYWDCYEMNKALGSSNNEILSKCQAFL
jgi:hypothetical protein